MPVNPFFAGNQDSLEQDLLQELEDESIQVNGIEVKYLPKKFKKKDPLFGEDILLAFDRIYMIEAYLDSFDGFDHFMSPIQSFGFTVPKQATISISRERFEEIARQQGAFSLPSPTMIEDWVRPMEGDLVVLPFTREIFEITNVDHEHVFYQLGRFTTWRLTVQRFIYTNQNIDTGDESIDQAVDSLFNDNSIANNRNADNDVLTTEAIPLIDTTEVNPL